MTGTMEIMDATGHVTLTWDIDKPETVETARAEFERLKAAGFAFFVDASEDAEEVMGWPTRGRPPAWTKVGHLHVRSDETAAPVPVQAREFDPRRRRTTAVRPLVGG